MLDTNFAPTSSSTSHYLPQPLKLTLSMTHHTCAATAGVRLQQSNPQRNIALTTRITAVREQLQAIVATREQPHINCSSPRATTTEKLQQPKSNPHRKLQQPESNHSRKLQQPESNHSRKLQQPESNYAENYSNPRAATTENFATTRKSSQQIVASRTTANCSNPNQTATKNCISPRQTAAKKTVAVLDKSQRNLQQPMQQLFIRRKLTMKSQCVTTRKTQTIINCNICLLSQIPQQ